MVLAAVVGTLLGRFAFNAPEARSIVGAIDPNPTPEARLASLEARLEVRPDDVEALQQLGVVATTLGIESGDIGLFARADEAIDRAESLAPGTFGTAYARASLALTLHRFDEALEHGRVAVDRNPFNTEALGIVVDAQVELGHYDGAAADLQRMLDLDPGLPALARASYVRELHGDVPGALLAMQQAEAAGDRAGYRTSVAATLAGRLHLRLGQLDEAEAAFERAATALPGSEPAALGLATVRAVRGDLAGATEDVAVIVEQSGSAASGILLGDLLRAQGRGEDARDADAVVLDAYAAEEAVGHLTDLDRAAFVVDRGDDPAEALALARYAYGIRPGNVAANDTLGWALTRAGRPAEAIPHVEQALRLGTTDAATRIHAAAAYAGVGDRERAAAELRTALGQPFTAYVLLDVVEALAADLDVPLPDDWPA